MGVQETIAHISASADEQLQLRRIADKAEQCRRQNIPAWTKFLTPRERDLADKLLPLLGNPTHVYLGGHEEAERVVLYFLPDWLETPSEDDFPISCVRCTYPLEYGTIGHRDILGSLMGLGIERETLGDIYPSSGSADIVVLQDILPYVMQNFFSAGKVHFQLREIGFHEMIIPERKTSTVRDTVASVRLDSIVSSAFGMAREKAAALIKSGRVQIDHLDCLKPDRAVQEGAVITARGFGKAVLTEVGGLSKKGRTGVVITKYIG